MGTAYLDAHSLWQQFTRSTFPPLSNSIDCDTVVVGAGIAGLTTAYLLTKAGQSVVVLDRERLGLGETGLTSAHLSSALDERYVQTQRLHGQEGARLAAESHVAAINLIEQIQQRENIDCEFERVPGYLFLDPASKLDVLMTELKATHEAGLSQVKLLARAPLNLFDTGPCLLFPDQAQFHPLKYLNGLAQACQREGGKIFLHSEVTAIKGGRNAHVKTSQGHLVSADNVVVATNVPINNKVAVHTKNAAYRSYLAGLAIPEDKVENALIWDTADPYHYIRFVRDHATGRNILLVGGEDHRTGQDIDPEHHFDNLRRWIETHLNVHARIEYRWSGQIMEPIDGLAYIGRNPNDEDNVFIITGDSGHGLTHGSLGGLLIRDLILGRENFWAELYDPSRLHFRSMTTFMKEAAQSTLAYGDWLSDGDVDNVQQVQAGEGAVLREGLKKIAVYRDELSRVHCFSAVCPHLGGIVRWNSAEKTWDCPCHGSRFDRFGQVINGPAIKELMPVDEPTEGQPQPIASTPPTPFGII